jgi:hypothetical protein
MKCKECKFWEEVKDEYDPIASPEDEDGGLKKMPFEVRICKSPNITLFERNPNPNGVSLCDGSDYMATMYTGPEFGCINGKRKGE